MKIYAIVSGCYSDWSIHGYVSDLEAAYRYCAEKNGVGNGNSYEDYYPIEIECLDGDVVTNITFNYKYRAVFYLRNGTWTMRDFSLDDIKPTGESIYCNILDGRKEYNALWIRVEFTMTVLNFDRAKKVAQDKLYQYLAEEQGL